MIVGISLSSLQETKPRELALRFLLGGAITAVTGIIAMQWGPVVGGLFLAFPAIFPASVTLVEAHAVQKKKEHGLHGEQRGRDAAGADAAGAAVGSVGLMIFGLVMYEWADAMNFWTALSMATLGWLSASASMWGVWRRIL